MNHRGRIQSTQGGGIKKSENWAKNSRTICEGKTNYQT